MNNRDKRSELESAIKNKKAIPYDEFFLLFRRAAYKCYKGNHSPSLNFLMKSFFISVHWPKQRNI